MSTVVTATDPRPWVDAWNKEKLVEALIERMDNKKGVGDAGIDAIVAEVRPANSDAAVGFLKRLQEVHKKQLRSMAFDVRDYCRKAKDGYWRADHEMPRTAAVFGLDLAGALEKWEGAHSVLNAARDIGERAGMPGTIDTSEAVKTIADLTPAMRSFADDYDAMLRGERFVSDVFPKATLFALFPELKGKDLPALHEALADLVSRADEGMLVGLFNHRWLKREVVESRQVQGPLRGDLNIFVALLRKDAEELRKGFVFGPSTGWGWEQRGTNPTNSYLRSDAENTDEGYGLIPAFLYQLAIPAYERDSFSFGDTNRAKLPGYKDQAAPPVTIRVDSVDGDARITIG